MVCLAQDRQWQKVNNQLAEYSLYQNDWDGYGSSPAPACVFQVAAELLKKSRTTLGAAPSTATISPSGAIQIEWWSGSNVLQAEIRDAAKIDWVEFGPNKKPDHWNEAIDPTNLSRGTIWGATGTPEELGVASASET